MNRLLREAFEGDPLVGEVRGLGLVAAVEFVAAKDPMRPFDRSLQVSTRITRRARELGVITRALPVGDSISFSPPFVISEADLDEMVSIVRRAVDQVAEELHRESS